MHHRRPVRRRYTLLRHHRHCPALHRPVYPGRPLLREDHLQTLPNYLRSEHQTDGDSRQTGAEGNQHARHPHRSLHRLYRGSDAVENVRSIRREVRESTLC